VWFYDFTTGDPVWPFTTGPDPVPVLPSIPGKPVTQFLRVDSRTPRVMTLNIASDVKYWVLDDNDRTGVRWLDPMIVIRGRSGIAQKAQDSVMLGVVCAVLGAAVATAVTLAMS
jgi:hypothetical protein